MIPERVSKAKSVTRSSNTASTPRRVATKNRGSSELVSKLPPPALSISQLSSKKGPPAAPLSVLSSQRLDTTVMEQNYTARLFSIDELLAETVAQK